MATVKELTTTRNRLAGILARSRKADTVAHYTAEVARFDAMIEEVQKGLTRRSALCDGPCTDAERCGACVQHEDGNGSTLSGVPPVESVSVAPVKPTACRKCQRHPGFHNGLCMYCNESHSAHCEACTWRMDQEPGESSATYGPSLAHYRKHSGHAVVMTRKDTWGTVHIAGRFA